MGSNDMDLKSVLTEYSIQDGQEQLTTFFSTLANNVEMQNAIYYGISLDDSRIKPDLIPDLLQMLLKWFRTARRHQKHLVFQFIPHLIALSLSMARLPKNRKVAKEIDVFLLILFNNEILDESGQPKELSCQVPSLNRSSVYHDGSNLDPTGLDQLDRISANGCLSRSIRFSQLTAIRAHNRMVVVEALLMAYNGLLGDLSRNALDHYLRTVQKMLQRGYAAGSAKANRAALSRNRIHLSPDVLIELSYGAYFCVYNGLQSSGGTVLELIRQRGAALGSPSVLLVANSIRTLSLNSGPSQLPTTSIMTPSQIAKNLITNASFRAKKIGDDIPKVEGEQTAHHTKESNPALVNNLKALANMSSINEEAIEEVITGGGHEKTPLKGIKESALPKIAKDKIMRPKIPGFMKKNAETSEKDSSENKTQSKNETSNVVNHANKKHERNKREGSINSSSFGSEVIEMTKLAVKGGNEKKKEKPSLVNKNSGMSSSSADASSSSIPAMHHQQTSSPGVHYNGLRSNSNSVNASEISSMEQVEALIQMKKLPAETVTIHSPESGTTIF